MSAPSLAGTPSDEVSEVLALGRSAVTAIFVSMCARQPEGKDAEYLRWHTFDHRPEQYRLSSIRASVRLVSTPECRSGRAISSSRFDSVDHVMTYFFSDLAGFEPFNELGAALGRAGRIPYLLPTVERGVYRIDGTAAAPRIKVGADVLPWWPFEGVYILIEEGTVPESASDLIEVPGVAGAWTATGIQVDTPFESADHRPFSSSEGNRITYCFLDEDPVTVAPLLQEALGKRWASDVTPLFAAPFYPVAGPDCASHLP